MEIVGLYPVQILVDEWILAPGLFYMTPMTDENFKVWAAYLNDVRNSVLGSDIADIWDENINTIQLRHTPYELEQHVKQYLAAVNELRSRHPMLRRIRDGQIERIRRRSDNTRVIDTIDYERRIVNGEEMIFYKGSTAGISLAAAYAGGDSTHPRPRPKLSIVSKL